MPSFTYTMIDKLGKEKKGTMEAVNESKVMTALRAEGYIPVTVMPQSILNKDININLGNSIKPRDLSVFCRQFVSILSAGVSIVSALDMLSEQTENKVLSNAIKEVQIAVEKGETLTDAMKSESKVFPDILIQMVAAGEASGSLEIAFRRLAVHFEKDSKLKAQVKKAMIYPIIVGLVAVGVVFVMMMVVIPNFMAMFEDMDITLPFMTQVVVHISKFVTARWYVILALLTALFVVIQIYKKSPSGKQMLGQMKLKVPIFGKLTTKTISARYARTLSTLLAAGLPMIEAIAVTAGTIDNVIARQTLLDAKEEVAKGIPLSSCISSSGIFPPVAGHMTKIGEETGNMEGMLEKLADYYDEEVEIATESLMAIMEPLIIVVLALVVGVLIIAIMQPMMSMYSGLEKL